MTDEVKAAIKWWRNRDGSCHFSQIGIAVLLADAFAALHPEDDDEPVTVEWFSSEFPDWLQVEPGTHKRPRMVAELVFFESAFEYWIDDHHLATRETRGQLRRLLAALNSGGEK